MESSEKDEKSIPPPEQEPELQTATLAKSSGKLDVYDWLGDLPASSSIFDVVEIRFKNTRKGFYKNVNALRIQVGDIVAVEASPGHDIGVVSLTGELVKEQLKKYHVPMESEFKKVYRKAKPTDIEKWKESMQLENNTMLESRQIAVNLNLSMKIGDVEYQGDKTKAIFFYIADERVDFRELIKMLAERFKVRVEMRQIGARQEAGRIGGIGSCGRELCCSTWVSNFISVTTNSARLQELSLNPQKLAGQCSKLKCCLNYEVATYIDARKGFPEINEPLNTKKGKAYLVKTDIFRRLMWFSYGQDAESATSLFPLSVERVNELLVLNRKGVVLEDIETMVPIVKKEVKLDYTINVEKDSLTRFDENPRKQNKNKNKRHNPNHNSNSNPNQKP